MSRCGKYTRTFRIVWSYGRRERSYHGSTNAILSLRRRAFKTARWFPCRHGIIDMLVLIDEWRNFHEVHETDRELRTRRFVLERRSLASFNERSEKWSQSSNRCQSVSGECQVEHRGDATAPILKSQVWILANRVRRRVSDVICRLLIPLYTYARWCEWWGLRV